MSNEYKTFPVAARRKKMLHLLHKSTTAIKSISFKPPKMEQKKRRKEKSHFIKQEINYRIFTAHVYTEKKWLFNKFWHRGLFIFYLWGKKYAFTIYLPPFFIYYVQTLTKYVKMSIIYSTEKRYINVHRCLVVLFYWPESGCCCCCCCFSFKMCTGKQNNNND